MNAPQSHRDTETVNDLTDLTGRIIHCAITVHKALGPGLLEKTYEAAMCIELDDAGLRYERQKEIAAFYKGRLDRATPLFEAQLLHYLRVADNRVALIINFNSRPLKDGIKRMVN